MRTNTRRVRLVLVFGLLILLPRTHAFRGTNGDRPAKGQRPGIAGTLSQRVF